MHNVYDMVIIGGGPGGYTAALYGARAGLSTVVLEKLSAGGQMALTDNIENYPGFPDGIDGFTLAEEMRRGAEKFGTETRLAEVLSVNLMEPVKMIQTDEGVIHARTVVIATGASARKLGLPQEERLIGRGVSYCAHCDGMFYKDKDVVVVGGGNSAVADAMILSRIARKVILVHRRDSLRATKIYHDLLMNAQNVEFIWNSEVVELAQNGRLTGVRIRNSITGEETKLQCDGLFVSIGRKPASELVKGQVEMDEAGYIIAGESTKTNIPGVFAVGDVRTKELRQIVTAVADGAASAHFAEEYISLK